MLVLGGGLTHTPTQAPQHLFSNGQCSQSGLWGCMWELLPAEMLGALGQGREDSSNLLSGRSGSDCGRAAMPPP